MQKSSNFMFASEIACPDNGATMLVQGVFRHGLALLTVYLCTDCGGVLVIPNAPQIQASAAKSVQDGSMRPVLFLRQNEDKVILPAGVARPVGSH